MFRVMAVYGAVAFVVLQVADLAFPRLGLPEWTVTLVLMLAILGFPIAVVLAWAFEQTPDGLRRTERADPAEIDAILRQPAHRRWPAGVAALLGVALLVSGAWWMGGRSAGGSADAAEGVRSIAVLPMAIRAAGPDGGGDDVVIFADGMHDDLLTQLSRIADLRVTSRTSVEEFRETRLNIRDIAARLGVQYVLEGAVDRVGDRVRVNVQLIDGSTDEHVWASTYDETMTLDNLFAIRDDLTRRIATSLHAELTPEVEAQLLERPTENEEAFALYTRGNQSRMQGGRPALERAIELFAAAAALDTAFAGAHAALAGAHLDLAEWAFVTREQALPPAQAAIDRALAIEPDHPEALLQRARTQMMVRDFERARGTLDRVLAANPSHARAHDELAALHRLRGDPYGALDAARTASALDPLTPEIADNLTVTLRQAGRDAEALQQARRVAELHPNYEGATSSLAFELMDIGRVEEGLALLRERVRRNPQSIIDNEALGHALLRANRGEEAVAQFRQAVRTNPDDGPTWGSLGLALRELGRHEEAVEAVREATRLEGGRPGARSGLARTMLEAGDTAAALAQLDTAMASVDDDEALAVASALFRAGRVAEAVALADRQRGTAQARARLIEYARFLFDTAPWAAHEATAALPVVEEALRVVPRSPQALRLQGEMLRWLGRTQASLAAFRQLATDQPGSAGVRNGLGWELLVGQRDAEAAGAAFAGVLAIRPRHEDALWGLARVHAEQGRPDSARAALARAREACDAGIRCASVHDLRDAWIRATAGDAAGARTILARYEGQRAHPDRDELLPLIAAARARLGDLDAAFRALEEGYRIRSLYLLDLGVEPLFDPLRQDPRYRDLVERMGLEG